MEEIKTKQHDAIILSSASEKEAQQQFVELLQKSPLPDDELLANLGLYLTSKNLSRLLFFYEIYKRIIHTHGIIAEFGVRWGQTLSLMSALRGIFEPFNRHRKIVGFDTFDGFKGFCEKDGQLCKCADGSFSVSENYEQYLNKILALQENLNPMSHLPKWELVAGDAVQTVPEYLQRHPETIISLAIFDFDIYQPTKAALTSIMPHLMRGSILVFDELCDPIFPGETLALMETIGLRNTMIERLPMTARISFMVMQ
jgi:hypothetical protein